MIQASSFVLALLVGWAATRVRLPGAGILIPMLATATVSIAGAPIDVSPWVRLSVLVVMGAAIGAQVDRESIRAMRHAFLGASIAAIALIVLGLLSALLLRALDIAPHGDLLATSPGALSAMTAAALENDYDAPSVAIFHVTRIVLIVLSIPLLSRLIATNPGGTTDGSRQVRLEGARLGRSGVPTEPIGHRTVHAPGWTGRGERIGAIIRFLLPLLGAALGTALGSALGLPFPIVVNAFVGGAVVAILLPSTSGLPPSLGLVVQSALAWLIGSMVDRDTLETLGSVIAGALVSSFILIAGGILIALALRRAGIAPPADVLATSPGALEVLTLLAAQRGTSPIDVGLYHLVRLLVVMLTLPLLLAYTL